MENNNHDRAARANTVLMSYTDKNISSDTEEALIDLLTDLRHFCKAESVELDAAVKISEMHFNYET